MEGIDHPVAKRQKLTNGHSKPRRPAGTSRLFAPYRTIGLVSPTAVPFTSVPLGKTTFQITTSVGRSLQTYDLRKGLNLVFITRPQTPETITASASWKDKVLAAFGPEDGGEQNVNRGVWVFRRGKKEATLEWPKGLQENVQSFCVFGSWIVGVCSTRLLVWKSSTYELWTTLQGVSPVPFTTCVATLPTFLNKILIGRQDGSAEIWNVSSGKLVYTILPPSTSYGPVTAIEPTPALSLVAIAYTNGALLIHDVHADQTLIHLSTSSSTPTTSISFRSDGLGAGTEGQTAGVMATASSASGDITLWDLNNSGRKAGVLRSAHTSSVAKLAFLPGQAILVSTGLDNSLKTWIFDSTPFSPVPRLLHQRSGHGAPITQLHFLPSASDGSDDTGKWLLSGSKDRSLWGWSLRRDNQSTELSQGAVQSKARKQGLLHSSDSAADNLKCPPITAIASSLNRDGGIGALPGSQPIWQIHGSSAAQKKSKSTNAEVAAMTGWESVLTAHLNDNKARTWFFGRKRAGRWAFPTSDGGNVSTVAMSACGTFGVVGSEKGGIDVWNLQSGILRQRFPARVTPGQARQMRVDVEMDVEDGGNGKKGKEFYRGQGRHTSAVVGLAVDALNKTLISAGGDGRVKLWDFATGLLKQDVDCSSGVTGMKYHRSSNLAALACVDDGRVNVVDCETGRLIRELWPSRPLPAQLTNAATKVNDFCFSSDGRWIAASLSTSTTSSSIASVRPQPAVSLILLWDLPTGHLIDAFKLRDECTTLALSPTGEFLATAGKGSVGVEVWSNASLFGRQSGMRRIGREQLEGIIDAGTDNRVEENAAVPLLLTSAEREDEDGENEDLLLDKEPDPDQLSSDLLSLSLVPKSRWQNLLHLDLIRQRNRPIEPPKKPEKAPFFLPSLGTHASLKSNENTQMQSQAQDIENERTRVLKLAANGQRSTFSTLLYTAAQGESGTGSADYAPLLAHLKSLNPAAADIEIRSLKPPSVSVSVEGEEESELHTFIHALTHQLRQRRDFELVQAWMSVFLRLHGDVVVRDEGLREAVGEWQKVLGEEKKRVQRLVGYCAGVGGWLRAGRV